MRAFGSLTFNEKVALGLLVVFVPGYFSLAALVPSEQTLWGFVWLLAWAFVALVSFVYAVVALFAKPDSHPSEIRRNLGRFLPMLGLLAAGGLHFAIADRVDARQKAQFARLHADELAGPPPQVAFYAQGIPDSGVAIVRSPGTNPEQFDPTTMTELTGERITRCERLDAELWSCSFD